MTAYATEKRLYRVRDDARIGGVCAGLAEYYEFDAIVVRILAIMAASLTLGLAIIAYLVLWARLPLKPESGLPYDVMPESAESSAFGCVDCAAEAGKSQMNTIPMLARLAVAAGLMILFLAVAMTVSPLVPGTRWWQFWPLCLLMSGLCLIIIPIRSGLEAAWHAAGIMLTAAAASILPMSLGIMSWGTVGCALERLWPLVAVSLVLFIAGIYRKSGVLLLIAAFCFVLFCLAGITLCVIPGEIESLLLHMPSGRSVRIAIVG